MSVYTRVGNDDSYRLGVQRMHATAVARAGCTGVICVYFQITFPHALNEAVMEQTFTRIYLFKQVHCFLPISIRKLLYFS